MLKNMKIGSRLGFGFGVIMALLLIVGVFSIKEINDMNDNINKMATNLFPKTVAANDIIDNVNIAARVLRNMALVKTPQEMEKNMPVYLKLVKSLMKN